MNPELIVVSGLPRSGTSLMMQMLHRGGLEVVTDGHRVADDDNPAGYYEFEPVKKLKKDSTWLPTARGKVVKIISQLLFELPETERYAAIFMERNLDEVLASQAKMLAGQGRKGAPHAVMRSAFEKHRAQVEKWLGDQKHIRVLRIRYSELIADPVRHARQINEFLGRTLNEEAMAKAVNPRLYRNRL